MAVPLLAFLLLAPGIALAGKCQVGDSSGNTKPQPKEGSRVKEKFNPTVTMTVPPGTALDPFMERLSAAVNLASVGEYTATYRPNASELEIMRIDGSEIDDLFWSDNDPGIQSVRVTVMRDRLLAFLGYIVEDPSPSGGTLFVTLNDRSIMVDTAGLGTAANVNLVLRQTILDAGYQVDSIPPYLLVRPTPGNDYFTQVGLRSTDPSIVTTDIGLAPEPNPSSPSAPGRSPAPSSDNEKSLTSRSRKE